MLFGRFCGVRVEDVPDTEYLRWVGSLRLENRGLRDAINAELRRRECSELNLALDSEDAGILLQAISAGRGALRLDLDQDQRLESIIEALERALHEMQTV